MKMEFSSKRILCVTSSAPRWHDDKTTLFVFNLAYDLQALGWEVDILAPHTPGALRTEVIHGVRIDRFRYLWPDLLENVCYHSGALIQLRNQPLNYLKLPALVLAEWAAIAQRLATKRYALLHSHWILPQGFVGMLARRINPIPHIVTVHGGDIFALRGRLLAKLKQFALHDADAVTTNSHFTETAVRVLAPRVRNLARIPMGVAVEPPNIYHKEKAVILRSCEEDKGPILIFIGRLIDEKGPEDLIRALALLREFFPEARAWIVGDGPDRPALESLVKQLNLEKQTRFAGWVSPNDLSGWLAASDIFVGPSRRGINGWVEAQGLTYLEAMIAGKPVIATRSGGIPDAVIHDKTGILVDERAPEQIAAAVKRLITNPQLARTLARQGQLHAITYFSRSSSAQAFSELFTQILYKVQLSK